MTMTDDQIIHIPSPDDNTLLSGSQALVAYPNIKHWMVIGCNDNFVLGVVRALDAAVAKALGAPTGPAPAAAGKAPAKK